MFPHRVSLVPDVVLGALVGLAGVRRSQWDLRGRESWVLQNWGPSPPFRSRREPPNQDLAQLLASQAVASISCLGLWITWP